MPHPRAIAARPRVVRAARAAARAPPVSSRRLRPSTWPRSPCRLSAAYPGTDPRYPSRSAICAVTRTSSRGYTRVIASILLTRVRLSAPAARPTYGEPPCPHECAPAAREIFASDTPTRELLAHLRLVASRHYPHRRAFSPARLRLSAHTVPPQPPLSRLLRTHSMRQHELSAPPRRFRSRSARTSRTTCLCERPHHPPSVPQRPLLLARHPALRAPAPYPSACHTSTTLLLAFHAEPAPRSLARISARFREPAPRSVQPQPSSAAAAHPRQPYVFAQFTAHRLLTRTYASCCTCTRELPLHAHTSASTAPRSRSLTDPHLSILAPPRHALHCLQSSPSAPPAFAVACRATPPRRSTSERRTNPAPRSHVLHRLHIARAPRSSSPPRAAQLTPCRIALATAPPRQPRSTALAYPMRECPPRRRRRARSSRQHPPSPPPATRSRVLARCSTRAFAQQIAPLPLRARAPALPPLVQRRAPRSSRSSTSQALTSSNHAVSLPTCTYAVPASAHH